MHELRLLAPSSLGPLLWPLACQQGCKQHTACANIDTACANVDTHAFACEHLAHFNAVAHMLMHTPCLSYNRGRSTANGCLNTSKVQLNAHAHARALPFMQGYIAHQTGA
eukprot:scaffold302342_cov18-Tisochrysis_lutea.AAC.1